MKKILILTYYWPPSGGSGVQRWLRFVKNLRQFGWEPTIFTAKSDYYSIIDESLIDELPQNIKTLRLEVPEPNRLMEKLLFWKKNSKSITYKSQEQVGNSKSIIKKIAWWIRGNFFIPDARFLWVNPSFKYLKHKIKKGEYDVVVSTGPPHSGHLIGSKISRWLNIPWVADFRDPWLSMSYLRSIRLTKAAARKHERLEKLVVTSADKVIVIGKWMSGELKKKYGIDPVIIHNGYNKEISIPEKMELDEKFSIVHIGSFTLDRNCDDLWKVLSELVVECSEFAENLEIKLVGKVSQEVIHSIIKFKLEKYLIQIDYIEYEQTLNVLQVCQVLLLPIDRIDNAEFVITGKVFEYLKAKRPILLIGPPEGDAAHIMQDCKAGYCCDFDDTEMIKETVLKIYKRFLEGNNHIESINTHAYSGYELTKKLVKLIDLLSTDYADNRQ